MTFLGWAIDDRVTSKNSFVSDAKESENCLPPRRNITQQITLRSERLYARYLQPILISVQSHISLAALNGLALVTTDSGARFGPASTAE